MSRLSDLYQARKTLRKEGISKEDLEKQLEELEENIIKDEILPVLTDKIEPVLAQIERPLVLVVEYTPNEPLSVKLSRKINIAEALKNMEAKQITPPDPKVGKAMTSPKNDPVTLHEPTRHIVNHTKGLKVTFRDGTVIAEKTAVETFKKALIKIGLSKVAKSGIKHCDYGLVSKEMRPVTPGRIWQYKVDDYYIFVNIGNERKKEDLEKLSDMFGLGLVIEDGK